MIDGNDMLPALKENNTWFSSFFTNKNLKGALFNPSSEQCCKPTKMRSSNSIDRPHKESTNQRSSQEAHGNSGGAAEIHSSGGRICQHGTFLLSTMKTPVKAANMWNKVH
ncbi:hypothetical protein XENOCAPTIV_010048 [Xenoophorus captivus]|uniref:Uncharacterized protein n=1 Tax=Xenoophorus captivus TaxID=1517983 RepID=A0ABV0QRU0_9TELE